MAPDTDWYYSILLRSVIINSVTFVTDDDFIFAKMEHITKLLDKNVSQLREPLVLGKNSDARVFLAPFLPFNNSCLFLLL